MTEGIPTVEATETATAEVSEAATAAPGKCTRLPVLTAGLRPKFHSNRQKGGRFTAGIACPTTGSSKLKFHKIKFNKVLITKIINTCSTFYSVFLPYGR
jgi:hypothetical protein